MLQNDQIDENKQIDENNQIDKNNQVLLLKKPFQWTSFDVVKKIKSTTRIKKIGHAGTLDPLATGLMIICTGTKTKLMEEYLKLNKEYTGIITVGATTQSFDLETQPENFKNFEMLSIEQIMNASLEIKNMKEQLPPMFSALKQDGKKLYTLARKGIEVERPLRNIEIKIFEIEKIELPNIYFRIQCSSGTYIRTIAQDFGQILQVGAYLSKLNRTEIGNFKLKDAISIRQFEDEWYYHL